MGKYGSLTFQARMILQKQLGAGMGTSKHDDKKIQDKELRREVMRQKIYSEQTYQSYKKQGSAVLNAIKAEHPEVQTLDQARGYISDYFEHMKERIEDGSASAWTVKLQRAAVAKIYGEDCRDIYPDLPIRHRADVTRSRDDAVRDAHFSEAANQDTVDFLRGTGMRRDEAEHLKGTQVHEKDDGSVTVTTPGKGGKWREIPVLDEYKETVVRMARDAGDGLVFPDKIHNACDVHGYRSQYATALYEELARPREELKTKDDVYRCRGDRAGVVYDRKAMAEVSEAMGHSRVSVIASSYLR